MLAVAVVWALEVVPVEDIIWEEALFSFYDLPDVSTAALGSPKERSVLPWMLLKYTAQSLLVESGFEQPAEVVTAHLQIAEPLVPTAGDQVGESARFHVAEAGWPESVDSADARAGVVVDEEAAEFATIVGTERTDVFV